MSLRLVKNLAFAVLATISAPSAYSSSVFKYAEIDIPFEISADGTWVEVFDSQESWSNFYRENTPSYIDENDERAIPPEFDFSLYRLIAGGLGGGSAGRTILMDVEHTYSTSYISSTVVLAGSNCAVAAVYTNPTIVILIPRLEKSLAISKSELVKNCE